MDMRFGMIFSDWDGVESSTSWRGVLVTRAIMVAPLQVEHRRGKWSKIWMPTWQMRCPDARGAGSYRICREATYAAEAGL